MTAPHVVSGLLAAMFVVSPMHGYGIETVAMAKPYKASSLGGVVLDPSGAPIAYATIERFDCAASKSFGGLRDSKSTGSVETDSQGKFHFDWSNRSFACLKVTSRGMNPLELEVKKSVFGGELQLALNVAT